MRTAAHRSGRGLSGWLAEAAAARLRAEVAERSGLGLRSNGAVVAQVWRDPAGRQVALSRLLRAVDVNPVDRSLGQEAGALSGRAGTGDAVDATVVAVADAGESRATRGASHRC